MIETAQGDILRANAEALVNTVNSVGVMGKGIAAVFKRLNPEMYQQYRRLCKEGKLDVGNWHSVTWPPITVFLGKG